MAKISASWIGDIYEQEEPTGSVNGVNTDFNLSSAPHSNKSVLVFVNGLLRRQGTDYTITGQTISFTTAPAAGQQIDVAYTR